MRWLLPWLFMAMAVPAQSQEFAAGGHTSLLLAGFSYHTSRRAGRCEFNPGIGMRYRDAEVSALALLYKNSECDPSALLAGHGEVLRSGRVSAGVMLGAAFGYRPGAMGVAAGTLSLDDGKPLSHHFTVIPADKPVFTYHIEVPFK